MTRADARARTRVHRASSLQLAGADAERQTSVPARACPSLADVAKLEKKVAILTAVVRLLVALVRVSGVTLLGERVRRQGRGAAFVPTSSRDQELALGSARAPLRSAAS